MRQFTMNLDEALHNAAKVHAARTGRSIAEILRELLAKEIGWTGGTADGIEVDAGVVASALAQYSSGGISRREAMSRCGLSIDKYSDFVDLMQAMDVKWPVPDPRRIEQQALVVSEAIDAASSEANDDED